MAVSDQFPVQLVPPYAGSEQLLCLPIVLSPQAGHADQVFQAVQIPFTEIFDEKGQKIRTHFCKYFFFVKIS